MNPQTHILQNRQQNALLPTPSLQIQPTCFKFRKVVRWHCDVRSNPPPCGRCGRAPGAGAASRPRPAWSRTPSHTVSDVSGSAAASANVAPRPPTRGGDPGTHLGKSVSLGEGFLAGIKKLLSIRISHILSLALGGGAEAPMYEVSYKWGYCLMGEASPLTATLGFPSFFAQNTHPPET